MRLLTILLLTLTLGKLSGDPLLDSWLTELSGRYARIYPDNAARDAQSPVTTWSRGFGVQAQPTYAGVSEISATESDVYIRTTNLGFHVMGPWYGERGNLFPNYPSNRAAIYRFPRSPVIPIVKVPTGLGVVGYFVDGIAAFDSRDAFSYSTPDGVDEGPGNQMTVTGGGIWNRDAYTNESPTFDPANAHQARNVHHYHANPPALRHLLGDSVDYDAATNTYTENFNHSHSPILGWASDGLPIYGPYGYSNPEDATSPARRMVSGYQKRDGSNGSTNLALATGTDSLGNSTGRTTRPTWLVRNEGAVSTASLSSNQFGPAVSEQFPLGHYLEDYAYKGDLGLQLGQDFDLDEYNIRHTITPDSPVNKVYAYFTNIEADGTPVYPYNFSRYFFGTPSGGAADSIPPAAVTIFEGGPEKSLLAGKPLVDDQSDDITLTWSSVAGGRYTISSSETLSGDWTELAVATADSETSALRDANRRATDDKQFYKVALDSIAPFDDTGFDFDRSIVSTGPQNNILLLILDDWGIDASELYNTSAPGAQLANMPTLRALAETGLLFTRGYAQPICSPTRATIMTGRQPFQHGVGNPQSNSELSASELTLPEILATEAPAYGLASFGKWHLGSGTTGPRDTGGWPNFTGTLQGGLPSYYDTWSRVKIVDGIETDSGTPIADLVPGTYASSYATSVQVDEASAFITAQGDNPWLVWMGFNAPHDPFEDPPASLAPVGGYSTSGGSNRDIYLRMLEALDSEVARLLDSVDRATTNIIVIGDNGTPNQVVQLPAGGLAGAKGSLTEGGIHVPFFANGPDVIQRGTSDELVHVIDLFATVLDLAGVNASAATGDILLQSTSLLPILRGSDSAERGIVSEKFGLNASDGRSLISELWPRFKLISTQDVTDPDDLPSYQMYLLGDNGVESNTLTTPPNAGDEHEAAYNALVAKDESFQPFVATNGFVLYLELPSTPTTGPSSVPSNPSAVPTAITIDGQAATFLARFDESDTYNRFWIQCSLPDASGSPFTEATVTFPPAPNVTGDRVFTAVQIRESP